MAEQDADRQTDIQALLAERKKFEAWIAQLDAKRENAASHVFERVHADYTKRLEDVRGRLRDEAESLRSLVGELEVRLGKEQERVTRKTDERAEAELRAMVGEFSEKEWTSTRSKLDSAVTDLRTKFDNTERELAELKELLASVTNAPAPARASVMMAAAVSVAEALDEAAAASAPVASKSAAKEARVDAKPAKGGPGAKAPIDEPITEPVPVRKSTPFDELAFLRSVAGTPSRPSGTAAVTKAPASAAAPAPAPVPPPEPVTPEPAADAEPIEGAIQDSVIESFAESEPETREPSETPARSRGASKIVEADSGPLGAPTPRTSQAIRSLKCQECGTLNFPTEWYCERCGGELAAF